MEATVARLQIKRLVLQKAHCRRQEQHTLLTVIVAQESRGRA